MEIFELSTKSGQRYYKTFKGASRAIDEDIADMHSTIISDTRDGVRSGRVVTEYEGWTKDTRFHDVYEIKRVPVYE